MNSNLEQAATQTISADEAVASGGVIREIPTKNSSPVSITKQRKWLSWLWKAAALAILIPVLQVGLLRVINPPVTAMMIFRGFDHLLAGESISWSHINSGKDEIARSLYSATIAGEDQRFFQHHGFDLIEIENAQKAHERHPNRPMRGASTLSQQVAKNLFLPPWHSFIRKGIEAYYTVLIEFFWPKERILQMYANIAEFAPNIYGAEAAAEYHFKRHASQLTPQQSAQLAAVLPNPVRWSASHPSGYIQRRASRILRQMRGIPTNEEDDGDPD